jgi:hypothetical protein
MQRGGCANFLHPLIWSHAIFALDPTSECACLGKGAAKTLAMIRQAFGGESMSLRWVSEWHAWFRADKKRWDRWRAKSRECSLFSLTSRGLLTKKFVLAIQTLNSAYYCDILGDCMRMCEDFTPNFGDKTGCCIMTTHHLTLPFSPTNFWPKATWLSFLHPPYFSVTPVEDKTERPPFWHNWGDEGRITGSAEHPHRTWYNILTHQSHYQGC